MPPYLQYLLELARMGQGPLAGQVGGGGGTQQQPGQPSAYPSGTPVVIGGQPISSGTTSTSPTAGPTSTPTDPNTGFPPAVGGNTPTNAPFSPPGQELGTSPAGSSDPYDPNYPYGAGPSSGDPLTFGGYNPFSPPVFQGGVDQQPAVGGPTDTQVILNSPAGSMDPYDPNFQYGNPPGYAGPSDVLNQTAQTTDTGAGIPTSGLDPSLSGQPWTEPTDPFANVTATATIGSGPSDTQPPPASYYPAGDGTYVPMDAQGNAIPDPTTAQPTGGPNVSQGGLPAPGGWGGTFGQGSAGNVGDYYGRMSLNKLRQGGDPTLGFGGPGDALSQFAAFSGSGTPSQQGALGAPIVNWNWNLKGEQVGGAPGVNPDAPSRSAK